MGLSTHLPEGGHVSSTDSMMSLCTGSSILFSSAAMAKTCIEDGFGVTQRVWNQKDLNNFIHLFVHDYT